MKKILLIIALIFLMALNVFAQTGSYTSHDIFYLPLYGAYGTDEYDQYNTYMEIADQLIWDNKTAIEAIEADYLVAADLTGYYTKLEIDAFGYITDAEAVTAIKADVDWNATEWDTAYGWGDHALAGYLTSVALNDLSDVDTTGVADGKIIKYDIATSKWIIADDDDTGTTYTAGTGLDLTGTVFSLDASAFDLSDFPADPNADRYLFWNDTTGALTWAEGSGSGVTTFVGLTDTPLAYTGYAGYFPKVNAGGTALEFAELTEADISDFGTYLTDITGESIGDLSDVDTTGVADNKILKYNFLTSTWVIADDTDTTYTAGTGMSLSGTTFNCTVVDTNTTYTAGDGLKLTGTQFSLDFKYDPSIASGEYSGIPDTGIVGETVIFGDLLYFKWSDKKYYKAKADDSTTAEVVAMAVEAKSANNSCVIIRQGYVRNDSWSAFTDSIVYLSTATAGKMQSSVPDSSGDQIKRVGQAVDSKIIFFNPSQDIGEVK